MSNLGDYQTMTTLAKKLGGPVCLAISLILGGYGILRGCEAGIKKIVKWSSARKRQKAASNQAVIVYTITDSYSDSQGLNLVPGDSLRVLEKVDKDVLLVEKPGDKNNPYCMSPGQLAAISDYLS